LEGETLGEMNTWAPIFSKIVDSSLWSEPDYVCKIFITMLALKDADHVVRYNAFGLAQRSHKSEQEVLDALKRLASPDRKRLEKQAFEGRRIQRVGDGWLILNGQFYQDLMRGINRREYQRVKQKEYRAKRKAGVGAKYKAAEAGFVKAVEDGDEERADRIVDEM
jgi:hypothetical protein